MWTQRVRHPQRAEDVRSDMQGEDGQMTQVMQSQAREYQGLLRTPEVGRGQEVFSPRPVRKSMPGATP